VAEHPIERVTVRKVAEYHIQLNAGDTGEYVFLPGDPGRVELIASHLDDAHHVMTNREFTTWAGTLDGAEVSVTSTGIGSPSAAIAVEELCNIGATTLIRIGSAGALSGKLHPGDVVIAQAAVREDGTSSLYAPVNVPAVAHFDVVSALRDGAAAGTRPVHIGTVLATDGFWPGNEPQRMPREKALREAADAYARCGVLAADMESAAIFMVAQIRGVRAGTLLGVVNDIGAAPEDAKHLPMEPTIEAAIAGLRILIGRDRSAG
jgi:uridine phosphorylase